MLITKGRLYSFILELDIIEAENFKGQNPNANSISNDLMLNFRF
jgi:hypothetical protein